MGTRGDVQPFVAVGKALIERGFAVTIVTHGCFKEFVESNGLGFLTNGTQKISQPDEWLEATTIGEFFKATLEQGLAQFSTVAGNMYSACKGTDGAQPADIVIATNHTLSIGLDIAEALSLDIWLFRLAPDIPTRSSGGFAHRTSCCGCINLMRHISYWLEVAGAADKAGMKEHELRFRKEVLDLPPFGLERAKATFMTRAFCGYSAVVVPKPSDWPSQVNVCGWWYLDQKKFKPPEETEKFLRAGSAPVCISFGSMVLVEKSDLIVRAVQAAVDAGKRVILLTGWAKPPPALPSSCHCVKALPHEWIFPKCCAIMHHGGAGTTARALQAGVPSIIVPILRWADQRFWGSASRTSKLACFCRTRRPVFPSCKEGHARSHRVLLQQRRNYARMRARILRHSKGRWSWHRCQGI